MKYVVETFIETHRCVSYRMAMLYFNRMIEKGYSYVELKKITSDFPNNYYAKSIKIFYK